MVMRETRLGRRTATVLLALGLVVQLVPAFAPQARAEGARLLFSPDTGTYGIGKTFTIKVVLSSGGGVGVNAADGTVTFDPALLSVSSVTKDGSLFSLWTSEPTFSNSKGTVVFSGGSPTPYTKEGGAVVSVVFKAQKAGTATLLFSSASVLAADGKGTDVLAGTGKAILTLGGATPPSEPEPEATPPSDTNEPEAPASPAANGFPVSVEITSPTHPDPEKWYANKNPEFKWRVPPDMTVVSAVLSDKTDTVPPKSGDGIIETKKFEDTPDGVWYFHLRFKSQSGTWSQVLHRKALIDMTPPEAFTADLKNEAGAPPQALLAATDTTSGIDHFEAKIDDRDVVSIPVEKTVIGAVSLPAALPGNHRVVLRALDRASNAVEITKDFSVEGRATVDITNVPGFIESGQPLIVEGIADRNARVTLRLELQNKMVAEESVRADEEGRWTAVVRKALMRGSYDLMVRMTTKAGAETGYGAKTQLEVLSAPFLVRFGWLVFLLFVVGIMALVLYILYERREFVRRREMTRRETDEVKRKTEAIFAALNEEVEEKIRLLDEAEATKLGIAKLTGTDVLDKFREALDISRDTLDKEIEDVEKTLEE